MDKSTQVHITRFCMLHIDTLKQKNAMSIFGNLPDVKKKLLGYIPFLSLDKDYPVIWQFMLSSMLSLE